MPPVNRKESAPDHAERALIEGILDGTYPPGSDLPGERPLCKSLGVARPALREALQRLSRDGWLDIQQGKATRVIDLTQGGTLSILTGLLKVDAHLYGNFVPDVLEMWSQLAPSYTAQAIRADPSSVADLLYGYRGLDDRAEPTVHAMTRMHRQLIDLSGNFVYALIWNSFRGFYHRLALHYYRDPSKRAEAHHFWERLREAALRRDAERAGTLMGEFIWGTYTYWKAVALYDLIQEEIERVEEDT